MITHILYRSFAKPGMSEKLLSAILEQAQTKNTANELTGLLVFRNNTFLQLLEGPELAVLKCLKRICKDQRHHSVATIFSAKSENRLFPAWKMSHISDKLIIRPLNLLNKVVNETMNCGLSERETMLTILKNFISPDYLKNE